MPITLVATHSKWPVSAGSTSVIFTTPGLGMLILGSERLRGKLSFIHDIVGVGFPVAIHSNIASSPVLRFSKKLGCLAILGKPGGAFEAKKRKIKPEFHKYGLTLSFQESV